MSLEEVGKPVAIYETEWKTSLNQAADFKHFWAIKNGRIFVAVATRTYALRFVQLPMMRGQTMELEMTAAAIPSDEIEARNKVAQWLINQP